VSRLTSLLFLLGLGRDYDVATKTGTLGTEDAVPLVVEKALAVGCRALTDAKRGRSDSTARSRTPTSSLEGLDGLIGMSQAVQDGIMTSLDLHLALAKGHLLLGNLGQLFHQPLLLHLQRHHRHRLGKEGLLATKEEVRARRLPLRRHVVARHRLVDIKEVPGVLAMHAVGVVDGRIEILLDTFHAHLLLTTTTVHHLARGLVERRDTDGTLGGHGYSYGGRRSHDGVRSRSGRHVDVDSVGLDLFIHIGWK